MEHAVNIGFICIHNGVKLYARALEISLRFLRNSAVEWVFVNFSAGDSAVAFGNV